MIKKILLIGYKKNLGDRLLYDYLYQKLIKNFKILNDNNSLNKNNYNRKEYYKSNKILKLFKILYNIKKADKIFIYGGIFQDITSLKSFLYYFTIIKIANIYKKHVIIISTSYEKFKNPISLFLFKFLKIDFCWVRDKISYNKLKKISKLIILKEDPVQLQKQLRKNNLNKIIKIEKEKFFLKFTLNKFILNNSTNSKEYLNNNNINNNSINNSINNNINNDINNKINKNSDNSRINSNNNKNTSKINSSNNSNNYHHNTINLFIASNFFNKSTINELYNIIFYELINLNKIKYLNKVNKINRLKLNKLNKIKKINKIPDINFIKLNINQNSRPIEYINNFTKFNFYLLYTDDKEFAKSEEIYKKFKKNIINLKLECKNNIKLSLNNNSINFYNINITTIQKVNNIFNNNIFNNNHYFTHLFNQHNQYNYNIPIHNIIISSRLHFNILFLNHLKVFSQHKKNSYNFPINRTVIYFYGEKNINYFTTFFL